MNLFSKMAASAAALMIATVSVVADDTKLFDGPYLGADIGLSDGGEFYYGVAAGIRKQLENDFVLGAEGTFGDYATSEDYGTDTDAIDYTWSLAGYVGYVFGAEKNNLVKLGAGYNNIHAYVEDATTKVSGTVDDLRAFVGYERAYGSNWRVRVEANYLEIEGSSGGQFTLGAAYQF